MSDKTLCTFSEQCQKQLFSKVDDVCFSYISHMYFAKVNEGKATLIQPDSFLDGAPNPPVCGTKYSLLIKIPATVSREYESISLVMEKMSRNFPHMIVKKWHLCKRRLQQ